jgi:hypothetical protein
VGDVGALDAERVLKDLGGLIAVTAIVVCSSLLIYATLGLGFTAGADNRCGQTDIAEKIGAALAESSRPIDVVS